MPKSVFPKRIIEYMEDNLVIFTYAPAGLGHLRVTYALYEMLSKNVRALLIGSDDKFIASLHRFSSINPLARKIMEFSQNGFPQEVFTNIYGWVLRSRSRNVYFKILDVVSHQIEKPKRITIICTHFGLAHQIAEVKGKLRKNLGVPITLEVYVTDDTSQYIWYVYGADLIVVPSHKVKNELILYAKRKGLPQVNIKVSRYPISPNLTIKLSKDKYLKRLEMLSLDNKRDINVCVPVSGAAVATKFSEDLIRELHKLSKRFRFFVVSKEVAFTFRFLEVMKSLNYVVVVSAKTDLDVVKSYEDIYEKNVIALEVTKPSEQAFKALCGPKEVGGSVLLFSEPVGRQEKDNLDFLIRRGLIPKRGLILPKGSKESALFIYDKLRSGAFEDMSDTGSRTNRAGPD